MKMKIKNTPTVHETSPCSDNQHFNTEIKNAHTLINCSEKEHIHLCLNKLKLQYYCNIYLAIGTAGLSAIWVNVHLHTCPLAGYSRIQISPPSSLLLESLVNEMNVHSGLLVFFFVTLLKCSHTFLLACSDWSNTKNLPQYWVWLGGFNLSVLESTE